MFELHPKLEKDCAVVGDLKLCRVLLMNNAHFPWLILVPRREGLRELFDLSVADYHTAMQEIRQVTQGFAEHTKADKMNVAALGNMVGQLHIHIVARLVGDAAWPAPVWGSQSEPYETAKLAETLDNLRGAFNITKM